MELARLPHLPVPGIAPGLPFFAHDVTKGTEIVKLGIRQRVAHALRYLGNYLENRFVRMAISRTSENYEPG